MLPSILVQSEKKKSVTVELCGTTVRKIRRARWFTGHFVQFLLRVSGTDRVAIFFVFFLRPGGGEQRDPPPSATKEEWPSGPCVLKTYPHGCAGRDLPGATTQLKERPPLSLYPTSPLSLFYISSSSGGGGNSSRCFDSFAVSLFFFGLWNNSNLKWDSKDCQSSPSARSVMMSSRLTVEFSFPRRLVGFPILLPSSLNVVWGAKEPLGLSLSVFSVFH